MRLWVLLWLVVSVHAHSLSKFVVHSGLSWLTVADQRQAHGFSTSTQTWTGLSVATLCIDRAAQVSGNHTEGAVQLYCNEQVYNSYPHPGHPYLSVALEHDPGLRRSYCGAKFVESHVVLVQLRVPHGSRQHHTVSNSCHVYFVPQEERLIHNAAAGVHVTDPLIIHTPTGVELWGEVPVQHRHTLSHVPRDKVKESDQDRDSEAEFPSLLQTSTTAEQIYTDAHVIFPPGHNITARAKRNMAQMIAMMQLSEKVRGMTSTNTGTHMVWELAIRPLIQMAKNMGVEAGKKGCAMLLVQALTAIISALLSQMSNVVNMINEPNNFLPLDVANAMTDFEQVLDTADQFTLGDDGVWRDMLVLTQVAMKAHETARTKSTEVAKVITRASSSRELKDVQRMQKERKEARKHAMTATAAAGKAIVRAAAVAAQEKAADSFLQLSSNSADSDRERHMEYLRMREEAILTATNQDTAESFEEFQQTLQAALQSQQRTQFIISPLVKIIEPKITDQVGQAVLEQAVAMMRESFSIEMVNELKLYVNLTVSRDVTRGLITRLTEEISKNVVSMTAQILVKDLTELTTMAITKAVAPELTYSLSVTIAKSLTRAPITDYYCYFCLKHEVYCDDCKAAMLQDYYLVYYCHYFSHYYERYYTFYYQDYYSKLFSNGMSSALSWGGTENPVEPVNPCLDPEDDECIKDTQTPHQDALAHGAGMPKT